MPRPARLALSVAYLFGIGIVFTAALATGIAFSL